MPKKPIFGMTAKEWRNKYPDLAKNGNIRDYTDILHLVVLNNLQNINARLIEERMSQFDRLVELNKIAKNQMDVLCNNNIYKMEILDDKREHK